LNIDTNAGMTNFNCSIRVIYILFWRWTPVLISYGQIEAVESWEESIDDVIASFEKQHRRKLLYNISFY